MLILKMLRFPKHASSFIFCLQTTDRVAWSTGSSAERILTLYLFNLKMKKDPAFETFFISAIHLTMNIEKNKEISKCLLSLTFF
jgi:hypothetical protein